MYLDVHERLKPRDEDGNTDTTTSIVDDIEFEIELVKRAQVDVDYILKLIDEYREQYGSDRDREYELLERLRHSDLVDHAEDVALRRTRGQTGPHHRFHPLPHCSLRRHPWRHGRRIGHRPDRDLGPRVGVSGEAPAWV